MNEFLPKLLPLTVAVPLGMSIVILLVTKATKRLADILAPLTTLFTLVLSFAFLGMEKNVYWVGKWYPPIGITMYFDGVTSLLLIVVNTIAFISIIYSISYMEKYSAKPKFYALFSLMLAGMNGVIITCDMFNLFVFLEIASLASYALVGFGVEHEELEASFKYLILGSVASTMILLGVALTYSITGSLNMADASQILKGMGFSRTMAFASGAFIMGFALKAGLFPFHAWLPDAHPSAPAPISAMLSGVLIKALGVYAMVRMVFFVLGPSEVILQVMMLLGALSLVLGGFLAVGQWDMKRMFAYSSISQVGYIVLALGLGTPLGLIAGLFHLANHAIFKSLLFLTSGAVEHATGTKNLRKLGGIGQKMPVTSSAMVIGSLSISGIPPFNGFFSKLLIILACIQANQYLYAALAVLSGLLTLMAFFKTMRFSIFGELPRHLDKIKEVPFSMAFSLITLSVVCLGVGLAYLFSPVFSDSFLQPASDSLLDGLLNNASSFIKMVLGG